jgi:hypothetical protein
MTYLIEKYLGESNTYKNIVKKLKGDWKRVHGTGAAAKHGAWIKNAFETEADFLSAEIEVADQQTGKSWYERF